MLTSSNRKRFDNRKLQYLGLGETNLTGDIVDLNFAVGFDDSGKIKVSAGESVDQNNGPNPRKSNYLHKLCSSMLLYRVVRCLATIMSSSSWTCRGELLSIVASNLTNWLAKKPVGKLMVQGPLP